MESRSARMGRGLVAASFATFVAALSHTVAADRPPALLGIVLTAVFAVPLCVLLTARRFSWLRLSFAVAASQLVFHLLLSWGVGASAGHAAQPIGVHPHGVTNVELVAAPIADVLHADALMWAAHGVAAVLTVVALGAGERALRGLLALTGWAFVARLLTWRPTPAARPLPIATLSAARLVDRIRFSVCRRRGPPLAAWS